MGADPEIGKPAKKEVPAMETSQRQGTFKWKPFNPFVRIIFGDIDALVKHGYKTRLEPGDVYPEETVVTDHLNINFQPAWEAQLKKEEPQLRVAILAGNMRTLLITAILYATSQACSLAGPLLLQRIVAGIACQPYKDLPGSSCEDKNQLYYYCIGLFLAPAVQSVAENHCNYMLYLMGTRMRNALMASIYRKCLVLSNSSMQAESTGKVVTLMSNDAQKLQDATFAIHAMWGSPCLIVAILVLLWYQVGWGTFVGLGVMLTLVPVTGFLAAKLASFRRELMSWTDKRIGLMSEVVSGIQMIKFYAWEVPFQKDIMVYRNNEARILRAQAFWQGIFGVLLFMGPNLVAIFCFGSYSIAGKTLSPANAYAALSYFSLLRFPMSFLPMLITMIINALVALQRIQGFLLRSEAKLEQTVDEAGVTPGDVKVVAGEFVWDDAAEKPSLSGVDFSAKSGTLTMIVGSVGSGKSSVLSALIGSMSKRSGTVLIGGRIAYVAQTSWVMNDTLQENVLMGSDMDVDRYRRALRVSQLGPDLKILPNGDLTEIGDRGITLSGGQKQRVSVARAVFDDADVYLLDDPLSAVDSHVGRALFEQCIRGPMRDKTVILVTNALQYLPHADNIIWMDGGVVKGQGTYSQLIEQGMNVAELAHMEDEEDKDQDTVAAKVEPAVAGKGGKKQSMDEGARKSLDKSITLKRQAADADRNLTGVESREAGNVSMDVVTTYFQNGGGIWVFLSIMALFGLEQGARAYTDRWVGIWFSDPYGKGVSPGWFYLGIYCLLGLTYGTLTFVRTLDFLFMCVRAAVNMHNGLLAHILRLPKSFFDTNPSGRILNRFSRDTDIMDSTLPASLIQFAGCIAILIANIVVIAIATRWFAIAIPPLLVIYFFIQRYYIPTARELQRIESVTRSPIYSKFGEALLGVPTIRAYRKEGHFTKVSDDLMETNARAYVTQKLAAAWLAMRLDMLGLLVLCGTGALCIQGNLDPGLAGLAILYALDLTRYLKHGTNMASQSEANFNSVERIAQYMAPEPEAAPDTAPEVLKDMPKDWPTQGGIVVSDLVMRYRPDMPLVLKGVSFVVKPGEKVGLVGRTGSGKSSILLALFRMVEPESGCVMIDGIDTRTLGVRHLRSKMSIIPQDPFLYKGTVRRNLDPLELHSETALWEVLETVGLKPAITILEAKLDHLVVDNGANFSLGQRQLFCLARAMLRNSRILMLDEATASVDLESDAHIQTAIRTTFRDCTMLTIAHRLNTIMDSDRVVVLEDGHVKENDEPAVLLEKDDGIFTGFVAQTGKSSARYLKNLAHSARTDRAAQLRSMSLLHTSASFKAGHPDEGPSNGMSQSFTAAVNGGMRQGSAVWNADLEVIAETDVVPQLELDLDAKLHARTAHAPPAEQTIVDVASSSGSAPAAEEQELAEPAAATKEEKEEKGKEEKP